MAEPRIISQVYVDPDHARTMREYILARHNGAGESAALQACTGASVAQVRTWHMQESWEHAYRAIRSLQLANDERISNAVLLSDLIERRQQIHDIVREAYDDSTNPQLDPASKSKAQQRYVTLSMEMDKVNDRVEAALIRVSGSFADTSALPKWVAVKDQIVGDLRDTYAAKGPQYELLIERTAAAILLQKQMEDAPAAIRPQEYARLSVTVVTLINQLQKYTEATKSQAVREEVQEALVSFMKIVENIVAPEAPSLWNRVVQEVVRRAGGTLDGQPLLASGE